MSQECSNCGKKMGALGNYGSSREPLCFNCSGAGEENLNNEPKAGNPLVSLIIASIIAVSGSLYLVPKIISEITSYDHDSASALTVSLFGIFVFCCAFTFKTNKIATWTIGGIGALITDSILIYLAIVSKTDKTAALFSLLFVNVFVFVFAVRSVIKAQTSTLQKLEQSIGSSEPENKFDNL